MNTVIDQIIYKAMAAYRAHNDERGLLHAQRVAEQTTNNSEMLVAWCHDLLEDNYVTYDEMVGWGLLAHELQAVLLLTHAPQDSYEEYITKICLSMSPHGELARQVKFYDLCDHLNPKGMSQRHAHKIPRYIDAMWRLAEEAAKKEHGWD